MSVQLQVAVLGEPKVSLDDVPLTGFISAKAQALLFYLAITGRIHSRDTLATLFWDEMPEAAAKKNLTKALSNLRKLVGDYLLADNQSAGLNLKLAPFIDIHSFLATCDELEAADDHLQRNPQHCQEALDLYQGELLQGFHVKDAPLFEEWLWGERERIHQLALRGLAVMADYLAQQSDYHNAIEYLNRLLRFDPLHEEAHLQMVRALAQGGQRGAALAHYEACRKLLEEELGVEPNVELQAWYDRVRRAGAPPPNNLPALVGFVGREIELTEMQELLNSPSCRLITIAGPGGIGKTRLALQLAQAVMDKSQKVLFDNTFSDGIYFLSLVAHNTIDRVPALIAETVGLTFQGPEEPSQQILHYLHNKEMLLLFDNFEQLLPTPEQVQFTGRPAPTALALLSALLSSAPRLKLVITSRMRLGLEQEHILHLSGMEVPLLPLSGAAAVPATSRVSAGVVQLAEPLDELLNYSSIQLFQQCAKRLRPEFSLTPENVDAVVQICRRVQGMPLGILLAASWITVLAPAEIQQELAHNFDLLESQAHDVPSRQRSVRAAFDYTWNLLALREQEIFSKLAVFQGSFTRQAAQQVTGATLRDLMTMVDKSLVFPAQEGRFHVHELLRQFGTEKLETMGEQVHHARELHARYYAKIAEQCAIDFIGPQQQAALGTIEVDGDNIRAAWQWAVDHAQLTQMAKAVDGLCQFYLWRGRFQEGAVLIHGAAAKLGLGAVPEGAGTVDDKRSLAESTYLSIELLIWLGIFARHLGHHSDAREYLEASLQWLEHILASLSSDQSANELLRQQGFALLHLGETIREVDREEARRCYEQSLALYRETNYAWGEANALEALGWLIQHWGGYREARQLYRESLAVRQRLGDQRGLANALRAQGGIVLYQGDPQRAQELISESLALMEANGDRVGIAACLGKLGETLIALGDFSAAQERLQAARAQYRELGLSNARAFIEAIATLGLLHQGEYERAQRQAEAVLLHFELIRARRGIAYANLILGWLALARGAISTAELYLGKSLTAYRELRQQDELGQVHALFALVKYCQEQHDDAQFHLQQAQAIAEAIQAAMPRVLAIAIESYIKRARGEQTEAMWLYHSIAQLPLVAASQWFAQLFPR